MGYFFVEEPTNLVLDFRNFSSDGKPYTKQFVIMFITEPVSCLMRYIILLSFLPTILFAQYEGVYDIPLPEEFNGMNQSITLYSSPNPDFPEYADETKNEIIWKHKTVIKANEKIKILETGAYLLNKGTWWRRAAFNKKQTKKMFAAKKMKLSEGDSVVFQENWRYGTYTQTGWNFWYVKGVNEKGEKVFGYEILETKGIMEDGTQLFPCMESESKLAIGNNEINTLEGKITTKNEVIQSFRIKTNNVSDLLGEYASENNFDLNKLKEISRTEIIVINVSEINEKSFLAKCDLLINGINEEYELEIEVEYSEKIISLNFIIEINPEKHQLFFKRKNTSKERNLQKIKIDFNLGFKKDYPGSMPWNDLGVEYTKN